MTIKEKIELAEKNKLISTDEILRDIKDTEREIEGMEYEIKGLRIIGDKMSHFRADAKENGIKDRKEFIENLKAILEVREGLISEEF